MAETRIYGIRHHGPGSARSLLRELEAFQPDAILIEMPAEAESALTIANHPEIKPPVALLIYSVENPKEASFYPMAEFSPEWNAIRFGLSHDIPIKAIDLPAGYRLTKEDEAPQERFDVFSTIAEAAGYTDGELWWEHTFEQRWSDLDPFEAVSDLMTELRAISEAEDRPIDKLEANREAHMRLAIKDAEKLYERIAVVCGAWHVPALKKTVKLSEDRSLLKDLAKTKVATTWVPWTYDRLAFTSGYAAGVISPAYYEHLWNSGPEAVARGWLINAARLLREEDLGASTASVIEAVRLAETLAIVRERHVPGLHELLDSATAVLARGEATPLKLVQSKLVVGEKLGEIPSDTPSIPIQADLAAQQKRLRLKAEHLQKTLDLDLRSENDLARSHLLHRLNMIDVPWGHTQEVRGKSGTFHEYWQIQWAPELVIRLILASRWGATVEAASSARAIERSQAATALPDLTALARDVLLAGLTDPLPAILTQLQNTAAVSTSANELLDALPPLAWAVRYGDVRNTDVGLLRTVLDSTFVRGCISLPAACTSLDDDAAAAMGKRLDAIQNVVSLLEDEEHRRLWQQTLITVAGVATIHGLVAGRIARLLLDDGTLSSEEVATRLNQATSHASTPAHAAGWIEGLLGNSGALLLHDDRLWSVVDNWLNQLEPDPFTETLPLLRRTFSTFPIPERRQLWEKVAGGPRKATIATGLNQERANRPLPLLQKLLGLEEIQI